MITTLDEVVVKATEATGWALVELDGEIWQVFPTYIGCVAIGEAYEKMKAVGLELPTPALVDAIWRQADLVLPPITRRNDGTHAEMASPDVYRDHLNNVQRIFDAQPNAETFELAAGGFKDVVMIDGKPGIYGWHVDTVDTAWRGIKLYAPATPGRGRVIQQATTIHALIHGDYSQAVRGCRRAR